MIRRSSISFFILLLIAFAASAQQKIKVACIGNSITYGSGIRDRAATYPARLQVLLGEGYDVQNFGVSGATLLKNGDKPYWKEKAFADAKAFQPDIVIIKLGTNDTKPQNWKFSDQFIGDYLAFTDEMANLPSKPRIWVCYPAPIFPNRFNIRDSVATAGLIPALNQVSKTRNYPIIDLYHPLAYFPSLLKDGVHPDEEGAAMLARLVFQAIRP